MILSLQKALKILRVISDAKGEPVSLMSIAQKTEIPKPTCSHLLETLCYEGYVVRVSHTEGYTLGPSLHYLTRYGRYEEGFITLCRPILRWIERKSHATVILSVIQSGHKFIIDYADTDQRFFQEHPIIRTDDIYRTATGQAILAQMEPDDVERIYRLNGAPPPGHWDAVTNCEELLHELSLIRRHKVVKVVETTGSAVGYACPIFKRHTCIGAIGIAQKKELAHDEETLMRILWQGTKEIERRLRFE
ncbi:MAG: helix-turn-helix domain-containing protein [Clostridia bacterium]|nr:helix-turn-helix domain-containing protein [Clostridia bacterium]